MAKLKIDRIEAKVVQKGKDRALFYFILPFYLL